MPRRLPIRDPIAAEQRKSVAARRFGPNAQCHVCGESRPEALIAGSNPVICAGCDRKQRGKTALDNHHVAGKSNSPVTIPIPVNDHRASLSVAQYDWPRETRENPDGSPLLAAAGCVRGFIDTLYYLIEKLLLWIPEMLETLDQFLTDKLGTNWWIGTSLEKYSSKK